MCTHKQARGLFLWRPMTESGQYNTLVPQRWTVCIDGLAGKFVTFKSVTLKCWYQGPYKRMFSGSGKHMLIQNVCKMMLKYPHYYKVFLKQQRVSGWYVSNFCPSVTDFQCVKYIKTFSFYLPFQPFSKQYAKLNFSATFIQNEVSFIHGTSSFHPLHPQSGSLSKHSSLFAPLSYVLLEN